MLHVQLRLEWNLWASIFVFGPSKCDCRSPSSSLFQLLAPNYLRGVFVARCSPFPFQFR